MTPDQQEAGGKGFAQSCAAGAGMGLDPEAQLLPLRKLKQSHGLAAPGTRCPELSPFCLEDTRRKVSAYRDQTEEPVRGQLWKKNKDLVSGKKDTD